MTENKISLKEEYKNLIPTKKYVEKTAEDLDKLLSIDKDDYELAKDDYAKYLKTLYQLIECKNEEQLEGLKEDIKNNNPWKKALENSEQFRSIADSDYKIMKVLITKESESFIKNILNEKLFEKGIKNISKNDDFRKTIADELATPFFEKLFSRFEHVFDGNFEDPRVIILGINPRLKNICHKDFGLENIYKNIFDYKCPSYVSDKNHEIYKYYFSNGGFFFEALEKEEVKKNELRKEFMESLKKESPYALYEFFPYATDSEKNWYKNIKIKNGKEYLALEKLLPSQIWMLCLLTYTLKKAIFSGRTMYLFLTKNNEEFKKGFFDKYLELLNISNKTNINILTKNNDRNRNFHSYNIKYYFSNEKMKFKSIEDFFEKIWGIPKTNEEESEQKSCGTEKS